MLDSTKLLLDAVNPYVGELHHAFHSVPDTTPIFIELKNSTADGEVTAIIHVANLHSIKPRSVYIHRKATGAMAEEVSILSSHYEPLQYPLLFPHGTPGWSPNLQPKISQITWYRFRLLSESRFCDLGCLGNEYLMDMYSRVEEEHLNFIQQDQKDQLHTCQCHHELDLANNPDLPAELSEAFTLPSSFIGSCAWASENVSDALAICKEFGSPTFFVTVTTNPKWPEITSRLKPGQTASDILFMVARVFKVRMA